MASVLNPNTRRKSSVYSNGCIAIKNIMAPGLGLPSASGLFNAMADKIGSILSPQEDPISTSTAPTVSRSPNLHRLNLLLAEDNLPDALLIKQMIKAFDLPVEVTIASDGERALDYVTKAEREPEAPCPDFLLLDINLPKLDGFEVLRKIRGGEKCKDIPVMIISSSDSQGDRSMAASLDASYFRKPADYEEFMKLGGVLRRFLEMNNLL
jgi:chemotaxis family two-component system response regulator Rcp1